MNNVAFMSADMSGVAGWSCIFIAIIAFWIVVRDLLVFRAERIARALEEERQRAKTDE